MILSLGKMTMKTIHAFLCLSAVLFGTAVYAGNQVLTRADAEKLAQNLKYQHGEIDLKNGLAKLDVPPEFKFLDRADAQTVLVKLWGNPPTASREILGMLLPADKSPLNEDCWAVTFSYSEEGFVKDDDAAKINYDDLLKSMQKATITANKERTKQGYPTIEIVGWAEPPHYDALNHKLYWAKELSFNNDPEHTLNYSIRILGRRGVLELNAISSMGQLADIKQRAPAILGMVNFNEGNRYADFNPKVDKVAAYGIAALVAGGVAAKLGLFKLLWVFILAAKKFIIIGCVAIGAWFKRLVNGGKRRNS